MFDLHRHQTQALYYRPSYERLAERISHAAPELDIVLIDEPGQLLLNVVTEQDIL